MSEVERVVDEAETALRDRQSRLVSMLRRWIKWKHEESVDCSLEHDTQKLLKSIEGR